MKEEELSLLAFKTNTKKKKELKAYLDNRGVNLRDFFNTFLEFSLNRFRKEGFWDRGPHNTIGGKRYYAWDIEDNTEVRRLQRLAKKK